MDNQLEDLRKQIDEIDGQIVDLLAKRMKVVKKVGEYKKKMNLPFFDKAQFEKLLKSKIERAKKQGLSQDLINKIYQAIHEEALKIEKSL